MKSPKPELSSRPENSVTTERSPGVYVRSSGNNGGHDIDLLWSGTRSYFKDDRSGIFTLLFGFTIGVLITSLIFVFFINKPGFKRWSDRLVHPPASVLDVPSHPVQKTIEANAGANGSVFKPMHPHVTVAAGETLSHIADREYHNTNPHILKAVAENNHLPADESVKAGQLLQLPFVSSSIQ